MKIDKKTAVHISSEFYKNILPVALQGNHSVSEKTNFLKKYGLNDEEIEVYLNQVNLIIGGMPTSDDILDMVNSGFDRWQYEEYLYIYQVDLSKVNFIELNLTSSIEQRNYDLANWSTKKGKESYKSIDEYIAKRNKAIGDMTWKTYKEFNNSFISNDNFDLHANFAYNIKHGSKSQYATYIPHVRLTVDKPVEYDSFEMMSKLYRLYQVDGILHIDAIRDNKTYVFSISDIYNRDITKMIYLYNKHLKE